MGLSQQRLGATHDAWTGFLLWRNGENQERAKYDDDVFCDHRNR